MTTWKTRHREKDNPTNVKGAGHRMREAVGEHARHNHVHGQGASKMGADTHTATTEGRKTRKTGKETIYSLKNEKQTSGDIYAKDENT